MARLVLRAITSVSVLQGRRLDYTLAFLRSSNFAEGSSAMNGVDRSDDNGKGVAVYQVKDLGPVQWHHRMTLNGSMKQRNLGQVIRDDKVRIWHEQLEITVFFCIESF